MQQHVALITGASQGIGESVARALAKAGVSLMLCARNESKLTELGDNLAAEYPEVKVRVAALDVRRASDVEQVVSCVDKEFGRIDVLVNNAGVVGHVGPLQHSSIEDLDRVIDTNLKGAMYLMKYVLPIMERQGSGAIVNVNSIAGKTAYPEWSAYAASKFGLRAVTLSVSEEQRENNVRVIGIYPGAVKTPIWNTFTVDSEPREEEMLQPEMVADAVLFAIQQPEKSFVSEITITPQKHVL